MTNKITEIQQSNIPESSQWGLLVRIPEYDTNHPWGDEWPKDYSEAASYLSEWDYGEALPEICNTEALAECQFSSIQGIYQIEHAGTYAIVADLCGGITCYRLEESES